MIDIETKRTRKVGESKVQEAVDFFEKNYPEMDDSLKMYIAGQVYHMYKRKKNQKQNKIEVAQDPNQTRID